MSLLAELKRRNVIRVALFYIVSAWLVLQVAETVLPLFEVPDSVLRGLVILLALGFVPALVFAWVFEWTPDGIRLDLRLTHQELANMVGAVRESVTIALGRLTESGEIEVRNRILIIRSPDQDPGGDGPRGR